MEKGYSGKIFEGAVDYIIVAVDAADARIRIKTGYDRIGEALGSCVGEAEEGDERG